MAESASINDQIIKVLQETRRSAYEAGYRDALRDQAAARLISAQPAEAASESKPRLERVRLTEDFVELDTRQPSQRAPWGTSTKAIDIAFDRAGDRGIDLAMVLAVSRELGYEIAESSARSVLSDKVGRGEIERRPNGRWYRKSPRERETAGIAFEADPAAPFNPNQGGHHNGAALADR